MSTGNKYRPKSTRAKVWEAIRALKKGITVSVLCRLSGADESNVKHYVRVLSMAGYLRKDGRANGSAACVYSLVKATGPKAPVQKRLRCLWDPNTDEYWIEESPEVAGKVRKSREQSGDIQDGSEPEGNLHAK